MERPMWQGGEGAASGDSHHAIEVRSQTADRELGPANNDRTWGDRSPDWHLDVSLWEAELKGRAKLHLDL